VFHIVHERRKCQCQQTEWIGPETKRFVPRQDHQIQELVGGNHHVVSVLATVVRHFLVAVQHASHKFRQLRQHRLVELLGPFGAFLAPAVFQDALANGRNGVIFESGGWGKDRDAPNCEERRDALLQCFCIDTGRHVRANILPFGKCHRQCHGCQRGGLKGILTEIFATHADAVGLGDADRGGRRPAGAGGHDAR